MFSRICQESIVVFPSHGIQLETHRGFRRMPFKTRQFIPRTVIRDVIINEGLYGWNVRYYLAIMTEDKGHQEIRVAFEVYFIYSAASNSHSQSLTELVTAVPSAAGGL